MKSRTSSKTGQIRSLVLELHPLDCRKSFCLTLSSAQFIHFDWMFLKLADKVDRMKYRTSWKTGQIRSLFLDLHPLDS